MAMKITNSSHHPVSPQSASLVMRLLTRIQELETETLALQKAFHQRAGQQEGQDFKERQSLGQEQQRVTFLSNQLKTAQGELEDYKKQLSQQKELRAQDAQRISAQQEEINSLHRRVEQAMTQVLLLQKQLEASQQQLYIVQSQMRQMGQQIDKQQKQILHGQKQQAQLIKQLKPRDSATTSIFNAFVLAPLSLFFPKLYPYHDE